MTITSDYPFGIINPVTFDPSMLVSSTVVDADPAAWNSGTSYTTLGQVVSLATTQLCYEVERASTNKQPDQNCTGSTPYWIPSLTHALAWSVGTSYPVGGRVRLDSTHKVYEALIAHQGTVGGSSTVTVTIASPAVITWTAHGLPAGAEVVLSTTGALPTGLYPGTPYYVLNPTANTFSLSVDPIGSAIAGADTTAIVTTGTQSGTHTATAASTQPDLSLTGDNPKWLELGATNGFAAFDDSWGSQSVATNSMTIVLTPDQVVDSLGILNLLGSHISITCTIPGTGGPTTIYTKEIPLQTSIGVYDLKTYFLAPIIAEKDVALTDLLPYYQQTISITVTGFGAVAIGNISMGRYIQIGALEYGPTAGINSFSQKVQDTYGRITIKPGAFAKRMGGRVIIDSSFVDQCVSILAQVRDVPVICIGAGNLFSCLVNWGFFKDFEVDIAYFDISYCTITFEGLV